jgi:hypothetical protein
MLFPSHLPVGAPSAIIDQTPSQGKLIQDKLIKVYGTSRIYDHCRERKKELNVFETRRASALELRLSEVSQRDRTRRARYRRVRAALIHPRPPMAV